MASNRKRLNLEINGFELVCEISSRTEDQKPKRAQITAHYPEGRGTVLFDYPGPWETDVLAYQLLREKALGIANSALR